VQAVVQLDRILVVEDGRARMRLVTIGERHGGSVEIRTGLSAGEHVVRRFTDGRLDDQTVPR